VPLLFALMKQEGHIMENITIYIASSLDGYIARKNGSVDWLSVVDGSGSDYGYHAFYDSVDALIMGSKTYQQVLDFGEWPYPGKPSYIFTRQALKSSRDDVIFVSEDPLYVIRKLEAQGMKRIWMVGGAEIIASFIKSGLIDEYIISIVPILLGEGIPLFKAPLPEMNLEVIESTLYSSGLLQVHYKEA